jgi:hypothetical protein
VGPRAVLDAVVKRKFPSPRRESDNVRQSFVYTLNTKFNRNPLSTFGDRTPGRASPLCIRFMHIVKTMQQSGIVTVKTHRVSPAGKENRKREWINGKSYTAILQHINPN